MNLSPNIPSKAFSRSPERLSPNIARRNVSPTISRAPSPGFGWLGLSGGDVSPNIRRATTHQRQDKLSPNLPRSRASSTSNNPSSPGLGSKIIKALTPKMQRKEMINISSSISKEIGTSIPKETLVEWAKTEPHKIERIINENPEQYYKLAQINDDHNTPLFVHLIKSDVAVFERWVSNDTISVKTLALTAMKQKWTQMFSPQKNLLHLLFKQDNAIIDRFLDNGKTDICELVNTQLAGVDGATIFHSYALNNPKGLTALISRQKSPKICAQFIGFNQTYSAPLHPFKTVAIILAEKSNEILKWIVDKQWMTLDECRRKDAYESSIEEAYLMNHSMAIVNAVESYEKQKNEPSNPV